MSSPITDAHIKRVIAQTLAVSYHLAAIDNGLEPMRIRDHVNYEFDLGVVTSHTETTRDRDEINEAMDRR